MREVIIVTYYWPPSGGGGVQRWLKFAKYLPEFGFRPIIITPDKPAFQFKDPSLIQDVPADLEVIRLPIWEPYGILRRFTGRVADNSKQGQAFDRPGQSLIEKIAVWIRGNFFVPDPRVFWVKPTSRYLHELLNLREPALLITTGPPHSVHLIGLRVKKKLNIKWVADFRDPWGEWHQLKHLKVSTPIMNIHKKMEKTVAQKADLVVTVSSSLKEYYERLHPGHVEVIRNGYDPIDFSGAVPEMSEGEFLITHTGTIDDLRDPRHFLNAYRRLCSEDLEFQRNSRIQFIGIISESYLAPYLDDPILGPKILLEDYIPHNEIGSKLSSSSVLLLLLSDFPNNAGYAPGKLFEYLAAARPILALAPKDGETADIIKDTQSGLVCDPGSEEEIVEALKSLYAQFIGGEPLVARNIEHYSRRNVTGRLASLLKSL